MIMWHHYHQYHTCAFYWKTETLFHRFLLELPKIFCDVNYMSYKTIVKVNLYNIYIHIHYTYLYSYLGHLIYRLYNYIIYLFHEYTTYNAYTLCRWEPHASL